MNSDSPNPQELITLGRIGFEIELLAPRGRSRRDLANAIAEQVGGRVRRFFHPQGEHSKAKRTPFFENLTLGFVVEDEAGETFAQCVDDFTLQDDLDQKHPPQPGWYRVVSDDARLLRLMMEHADASDPLDQVLVPVADLFGVSPESGDGGMIRVTDKTGEPIVIGAPLPGERERPCELVTRPIEVNHLQELTALLDLVVSLDFSIPAEAATHIHFDAAGLCDTAILSNLVRFLDAHGEALKDHIGTNSRCRRLGGWPPELMTLVNNPEFVELDWDSARGVLREVKLSKFCDFNLRNLVYNSPGKHTFEVRILPVWLDAEKTIDVAVLFTAILNWAKASNGQLLDIPSDFRDVV